MSATDGTLNEQTKYFKSLHDAQHESIRQSFDKWTLDSPAPQAKSLAPEHVPDGTRSARLTASFKTSGGDSLDADDYLSQYVRDFKKDLARRDEYLKQRMEAATSSSTVMAKTYRTAPEFSPFLSFPGLEANAGNHRSMIDGLSLLLGSPSAYAVTPGGPSTSTTVSNYPEAAGDVQSNISNIILFDEIMNNNYEIFNKGLFKFEKLGGNGMSAQVDTLVFDGAMATRTGYRMPTRQVSHHTKRKRVKVVFLGLGQAMELFHFMTPRGRMIWLAQETVIQKGVMESLALMAYMELVTAKFSDADNGVTSIQEDGNTLEDLVKRADEETNAFGAFHTAQKPVAFAVQYLKGRFRNFATINPGELVLVAPENSIMVDNMSVPSNTPMLGGQGGRGYVGNITPAEAGVGDMFQARRFKLPGKKIINPFKVIVTTGVFFQVPSQTADTSDVGEHNSKFRSAHLTRHALVFGKGRVMPYTVREMFEKCNLFSVDPRNHAKRHLTQAGRIMFNNKGPNGTNDKTWWESPEALGHNMKTSDIEARLKTLMQLEAEHRSGMHNRGAVEPRADTFIVHTLGEFYRPDELTIMARCYSENLARSATASGIAEDDQGGSRVLTTAQAKKNISDMPVEYKTFLDLIHQNVPVFFGYLGITKDVAWSCEETVLATKSCSLTYIGASAYKVQPPADTNVYTSTFNIHARPSVNNPKGVSSSPLLYIHGYVSGANGKLFTLGVDKIAEASMATSANTIVVPRPPGAPKITEDFFCVSGHWHPVTCNAPRGRPAYELALVCAQMFNWEAAANRMLHGHTNYQGTTQTHSPSRNSIVFQTLEMVEDPVNHAKLCVVRPHRGHGGTEVGENWMTKLKKGSNAISLTVQSSVF